MLVVRKEKIPLLLLSLSVTVNTNTETVKPVLNWANVRVQT